MILDTYIKYTQIPTEEDLMMFPRESEIRCGTLKIIFREEMVHFLGLGINYLITRNEIGRFEAGFIGETIK